MTTFLITALMVMTLACVGIGMTCRRLVRSIEHSRSFEKQQRDEWMAEREHMRRFMAGVTRVLNTKVGGIGKRMSESIQIAEAITRKFPGLFKECPSLAYCLHANDQFLNALFDVAAECIEPEQRRRAYEMREYDNADVFRYIYESAGLPAVAAAATS